MQVPDVLESAKVTEGFGLLTPELDDLSLLPQAQPPVSATSQPTRRAVALHSTEYTTLHYIRGGQSGAHPSVSFAVVRIPA